MSGPSAATLKPRHGWKPHAVDGGTEAWKEPGNDQISFGLPCFGFFFFFLT